MAKISYYLKNPELKESSIYLRISYQGNRIRIPTGENIPIKFWLGKPTCRAKKTTAYPDGSSLNNFLNKLEKKTEDIIKDYKRKGEQLTPDILKNKVKDFITQGEVKASSFFAIYDQFIATTSTQKSSNTMKKFKTLRSHLKEFERVKKVRLGFDTINLTIYDKLTDYYLNDLKVINNTFGKYIASLKTFLTWSAERGFNQRFDYKKFKVFKEDVDITYLTEKELTKISSINLTKKPKLARVRDLFCLGCYTGLRFGDLAKLIPENIKPDHIIIKTQKTRDTLYIPLRNEAKEIIDKYLDKPGFLPVISNQKMNDYLKELGEYAGIDEEVTITRFQGAKEIKITKPKHKLISTHTARRTFVTLSLEQGARPEIVMQITGHKNYSTFKKYIKITNKVISKEMERVWNQDYSLDKKGYNIPLSVSH